MRAHRRPLCVPDGASGAILARLFVAMVCIVIVGGISLCLYATFSRSPAGEETRDRMANARDHLRDESRRWRLRLDELSVLVKEAVEEAAREGAEATQARERLEALRQRIAEFEKEFGPKRREQLARWRAQTEEAIHALRQKSESAGDTLKGLWDDVNAAVTDATTRE